MQQFVRMIPVLLLSGRGLYKTVRFGERTYLGDPLNIARIFNEKEVDELCLLDIDAARQGRPPDFDYIRQFAEECFMPVSYGGGLRSVEDCRRVIASGFEKVVINTALAEAMDLASDVAAVFGAQAVVGSLDARAHDGGWRVWTQGASRDTGSEAADYARRLEAAGVGEILLNAVDRDGTQAGYDLDLVRHVARAVSVPVIACGGARDLDDLVEAVVAAGAAAAAAGSLFVFYGRRRAVLINPPTFDAFQTAIRARLEKEPPP